MKRNRYWNLAIPSLLLCMLLLAGCGASNPPKTAQEQPLSAEETAVTPDVQETPEAQKSSESEESPSLEDLLGEDYVDYLTETITMQMGNRMDKNPDVRYFPIEDNAPLSDYVAIDETTEFEVDEEGNPVILFPAGTVTDASNGEQSFRIPKLYQ